MAVRETVKLYDSMPRESSFCATVAEAYIAKSSDDGRREICVILDKTLFFPEEGGQSSDTGMLGGFAVTDVQIDADGVIRHILDCPVQACEADGLPAALKAGAVVQGTIDWDKRFSNMQNHTGEHILSGLMHSRYGFDNVGFRLSGNTVTLDVNGQLSDSQILELEREANEVVFRNVPVRAEYPSPEVLERTDYRSKKEIEGPVRLVWVEGVDCCACCAPHVERTGEIGLIKILRAQKFKGGMRLQIVCGRRAVLLMQDRQRQAEEISHMTNRPQEQLDDAVRALLEEIAQLRVEKKEMEYLSALEKLRAVDPAEENVWLFAGEMDMIVQRNLVNQLCEEHPGYCGVFCGTDREGYRFIAGTRKKDGDSRTVCDLLRARCSVRGGGKPAMVQGTVYGSREEILAALAQE